MIDSREEDNYDVKAKGWSKRASPKFLEMLCAIFYGNLVMLGKRKRRVGSLKGKRIVSKLGADILW